MELTNKEQAGVYVVGEYLGIKSQKPYTNPASGKVSQKVNVNLLVADRVLSVEYFSEADAKIALGATKDRGIAALRVHLVAYNSILAAGATKKETTQSIFYKGVSA